MISSEGNLDIPILQYTTRTHRDEVGPVQDVEGNSVVVVNSQDKLSPLVSYPQKAHVRNSFLSGYQTTTDQIEKDELVYLVAALEDRMILDLRAPSQINFDRTPSVDSIEMRYSAVTCEPDAFLLSGYALRKPADNRTTELFIAITMYNEDEVRFSDTVRAVVESIANLCRRSESNTWGPDGWKKVCVCIIADGRTEINERTLRMLSLIGCYQYGIAVDSVNRKGVTMHIFEYTSEVLVSTTGETSRGPCPVRFMFCMKARNQKKLNSHRWVFNAFGPILRPNVYILLDVGTVPSPTALWELWKSFEEDGNVGGACGEICVDTRYRGSSLWNPLVAAQNFEYKISNILDKPLESVLGYITVLPGAFSAYRYTALHNLPDGTGPLASYFKGDDPRGQSYRPGLFERNMYLAEDRILSFELVTKKNEAWRLKYVKSAKATTDVPTTIPEFLVQRRRWLNGSISVAMYAIYHVRNIWTSGQSLGRKFALQIEFIWNAFQLFFSWTSIANFYLGFFFVLRTATATTGKDRMTFLPEDGRNVLIDIMMKVYAGVLIVTLICSLGNRPQGSKWTFTASVVVFGCCAVIAVICVGWFGYKSIPHTLAGWRDSHELSRNESFRDFVVSLVVTFVLYYMFFLPSYANVLIMYAMCNVHDIGWGTKGIDGSIDLAGDDITAVGSHQHPLEETVSAPNIEMDVDKLWETSRIALETQTSSNAQHHFTATQRATHKDMSRRTDFVLVWFVSNMAIIVLFTSGELAAWTARFSSDGNVFSPYLLFLFYSIVLKAVVRFTGSFIYLLMRIPNRRGVR